MLEPGVPADPGPHVIVVKLASGKVSEKRVDLAFPPTQPTHFAADDLVREGGSCQARHEAGELPDPLR